MTDREKCFNCLGRGYVYDPDEGFQMDCYGDMCPNCNSPWKCNGPHLEPPDCPRCNGSGFDPESDRYRTEAAYEEAR